MKAAVILFPGSNREIDMLVALERAMGSAPIEVWHKDADFEKVDLIVLPGGFSFGDYLRAGAMGAQSPVMREIARRAGAGVPVLGVCNGFQILTEARLLPGALMRNAGLRFVCRDVHLRVETNESHFTRAYQPGDVIRVPVAHHDGCYFADAETLARIEGDGQVAFRYVDAAGTPTAEANPNGSVANIAGVYNESRTVLGLMPHPEDAVDPLLGGTDGAPLFQGLVEALS